MRRKRHARWWFVDNRMWELTTPVHHLKSVQRHVASAAGRLRLPRRMWKELLRPRSQVGSQSWLTSEELQHDSGGSYSPPSAMVIHYALCSYLLFRPVLGSRPGSDEEVVCIRPYLKKAQNSHLADYPLQRQRIRGPNSTSRNSNPLTAKWSLIHRLQRLARSARMSQTLGEFPDPAERDQYPALCPVRKHPAVLLEARNLAAEFRLAQWNQGDLPRIRQNSQ